MVGICTTFDGCIDRCIDSMYNGWLNNGWVNLGLENGPKNTHNTLK